MTPRVIVSMTSFPAAIEWAAESVRSILEGSVKPDQVVMYLAEGQFAGRVVPEELRALEGGIFEIRWWPEDIRSYKKLIPALAEFPEDIIVTVDDDLVFHRRMLERLLKTHRRYPRAIVGHRVRRVEIDGEGNFRPYREWKRYKEWRFLTRSLRPGFRNLLTGGAGGLYPPHSLDAGMLDPGLFMRVAPTVDDIWFWAAAVAAGTKTVPVPLGYVRLRETGKPAEAALSQTNLRSERDVNRETAEAISELFPIIKRRIMR